MSEKPDSELAAEDDSAIGSAMKWSAIVLLSISGLIGLGYWVSTLRQEKPKEVVVVPVAPQTRVAVAATIPSLPWKDITEEAGINFMHVNGAAGEKLLPETMGSGVVWFDFDNDQDQDLFLVNSKQWPWEKSTLEPTQTTLKLYANDGRGHFADVTESSGLNQSVYGMGAAVGDYDNDGWTDLFVTALGENRLYRNVGGKFLEVTRDAGVAGSKDEWSTSAAFFDFDNDGWLDLFVGNYVTWTREIDLDQAFSLVGGGGRAYGPPRAFAGTFPYLYRNLGGGRFADVSKEARIQITNRDTGVPLAKSMGVTIVDVNQDQFLDIVVANDTVQNFLFLNEDGKRFKEFAQFSGIAYDRAGTARGAMGIDSAIFRSDGTLAIGIGNFANEMSALYIATSGKVAFSDIANSNGLGPPSRMALTFGLFFFDADLDGRLDILGANGHLESEISKVQRTQSYEQSPQLFWNAGTQSTSELVVLPAENVGADFHKPMVGRGAAYADIDADGDLDVLITCNGGKARLLRNDQQLGHRWVRLKLKGTKGNRDAIGAVATLIVDGKPQVKTVMAAKSYCSQCELPLTFGLGATGKIDKLTIHWPGGKNQEFPPPEINQLTVIEEPQ
jgi:hypothetical protein